MHSGFFLFKSFDTIQQGIKRIATKKPHTHPVQQVADRIRDQPKDDSGESVTTASDTSRSRASARMPLRSRTRGVTLRERPAFPIGASEKLKGANARRQLLLLRRIPAADYFGCCGRKHTWHPEGGGPGAQSEEKQTEAIQRGGQI